MPGLIPAQEDVDQFIAITQASPDQAHHFLSTGTNLEGAIEDYFVAQTAAEPHHLPSQAEDIAEENEAFEDQIMSAPEQQPSSNPTGETRRTGVAYTLDGRPIDTPPPSGWGQPARSMVGRIGQWGSGGGNGGRGGNSGGARIATFGSLNDAADQDDSDGSDDPDDHKPLPGETTYAGGERSGLAIQNPGKPDDSRDNSVVNDILKTARLNGLAEPPKPIPKARSAWGGTGNVLGTDEEPAPTAVSSRPDATSSQQRGGPAGGLLASLFGQRGSQPPPEEEEEEEEAQQRMLIFWRNGFSVEDGPLMSYDDPANQSLLAAIAAGRAPPQFFNVRYNQPISIIVDERRSRDYEPPPKKPMKPFEGSGNRLGSPAPEVSGSTPTMPGGLQPHGILHGASGGTPATSSGTNAAQSTGLSVDDSKPTTSVQVRLGDGTRLVARLNLTHTVGDLRNFVAAARADPRTFVLQTTFPNRELSDTTQTIEAAKLQNAVIVQRFT